MHDIVMTMSGGQVQRRVVTSVGGIYTSASLHEHFDDFQMTLLGRPMQRAESMIVSTTRGQRRVNSRTIRDLNGKGEKHNYDAISPLVHIVFGVVQPNPNLHGVSFAAPLKYVFHFVGETTSIRHEPEGKLV